LVVANKAVTDRLAGAHEVPAFVELAHFNALRGLDTYGDVRGLVVLGRPMPAPSDVEMIRGALTGWATPVSLGKVYYPGRATTLSARDGSALTVDAEAHPDALTEAVRAAVCEAEIVQAIGRGRAVNRSEENPLAVYVLGNVPLTGMMPDTVGPWAPLGPDGEYFSRHGIELEATSDMARLMGEDRERLKKARGRGRLGTNPSNKTLYWEMSPTSGSPTVGARLGAYSIKQNGRKGDALSVVRITADAAPLIDHLRRALPDGAELTAVHDPWAEGFGLIQCQVTGGLNFGLAPSH
jgi:putative DNA primase/helicase